MSEDHTEGFSKGYADKFMDGIPKKPTIAELEALLEGPDPCVVVMPDGSLKANGHLAEIKDLESQLAYKTQECLALVIIATERWEAIAICICLVQDDHKSSCMEDKKKLLSISRSNEEIVEDHDRKAKIELLKELAIERCRFCKSDGKPDLSSAFGLMHPSSSGGSASCSSTEYWDRIAELQAEADKGSDRK